MCGRFACTLSRAEVECVAQSTTWRAADGGVLVEAAQEHQSSHDEQETTSEVVRYEPRFNIRPTSTVPVVMLSQNHRASPSVSAAAAAVGAAPLSGQSSSDASRIVQYCRWGLVPSHAKDVKMGAGNGALLINARSESLQTRPTFQGVVRKRNFCVVPCNAFYEWKTEHAGLGKRKSEPKTPYRISCADAQVMRLAAIYDVWNDPDKRKPLWSMAILTRAANKQMEWLHDRMPCILDERQADLWIKGTLPVKDLGKTSQGKLSFEKMLRDLSAVDRSANENERQRNFMTSFFSPSKKQKLEKAHASAKEEKREDKEK